MRFTQALARLIQAALAVTVIFTAAPGQGSTVPGDIALRNGLAHPELLSEEEWNALVAKLPSDKRAVLQDARVAQLMATMPNKSLETKKDFLREIAHRLKQGAVPREFGEPAFSWDSASRLMQSVSIREDEDHVSQTVRVFVEQVLPLIPADEPPPSKDFLFWNSLAELPEHEAVLTLDALRQRFGRLAPSADARPVGRAIEAKAPWGVIQALIRAGVTTPKDWDTAARTARVDVLNELHAAGLPVAKDALVASTWAVAQQGQFGSLDWLIDVMPKPLPGELADIAVDNLLTQADRVAFEEKWPRIDRLLAHGADLTRVFSRKSLHAFNLIMLLRYQPEVAKALLARGLDPSVSMPPLNDNLLMNYLALMNHSDPAYTHVGADVIEAIVKRNPELLNRYSDELGLFPLYIASQHSPELGRAMIRLGADPKVRSPQGHTLLMMAAAHGDEGVAHFLIQAGADLAAVEPHGVSALGYAQCYERPKVVATLIAAGAPSLGRALCEAQRKKQPPP